MIGGLRHCYIDPWQLLLLPIPCSGGASGVMVIVVGNGHGDTSSNPGRGWLYFT